MKRAIDGLIVAYQWTLSPLFVALGARCRFEPSCSHYARDAVRAWPLHRAIPRILWRILKCGPWHPGGFDPAIKISPIVKNQHAYLQCAPRKVFGGPRSCVAE